MANSYRKELLSCFTSFVPFILSIPFILIYFSHRLSFIFCLLFIVCLFLIHFTVFNRFYMQEVFIRAHFLTFVLTIGIIWSINSPAIGLFTVILSIFHLGEYISIGLWSSKTLCLDSFLLNQSREYHISLALAYTEYFIEKAILFPNGVPYHWILILIGVAFVINGEYLRKLAMYTAKESFTHLIEDAPNADHRLVTSGIYARYRHPSYVGWFRWACGTQILLANPICFLIYLFVTWRFFSNRIVYEEITLLKCFGDRYREYQRRVPVGIPYIKGFI